MNLAYCDYIAHVITEAANKDAREYDGTYIKSCSRAHFDLTPEGYFNSTAKKLFVEDIHGKQYKITVEELV